MYTLRTCLIISRCVHPISAIYRSSKVRLPLPPGTKTESNDAASLLKYGLRGLSYPLCFILLSQMTQTKSLTAPVSM